ncbi:COQ9-domain-containing protein [Lasiosphaeris hirsuta]|uniref:Ubiquinone biosynthesis protein n=1 Tax=Lasiosphaeris hirsuta TaxID=260670 RepID=A0AA40AZC0_9PEZI|nr:COQ9-domain-containing protein [Lasiosphaeris hirsuta]
MPSPPAASRSAGAAAAVARRILHPSSLLPPGTTSLKPCLRAATTTTTHAHTTTPRHHLPASLPIPTRTSSRPYHSYSHPPPPGPFTPTESLLLAAAYRHVPTHGFSASALALGARDAGYLDISPTIVPDGVFSLVQWHLVTQREALAARSVALFGDGQKGPNVVASRVEALAWERLLGNAEVVWQWQEALAIMAQPSYVPASVKELAMLADEIWFLAGDVAVDPTWYTKRASLSAIYAAAELFMTNDRSLGFRDTQEFLRRRLQEASEMGNVARSVREWLSFTASAGINVLRSKGVQI